MVRVGINGFGSIGRRFYRAAMDYKDIEIVAVNDLTDPKTLAHLLKYDSNYGTLDVDVTKTDDGFKVGDHEVKVLSERDPAKLPWKALGVDVVLESTGHFRTKETAGKHIEAGAKKVIISAPGTGEDFTVVLGVNDKDYDPQNHNVISNASCTTNAIAPLAKVVDEAFGIENGFMTTIHAYTTDQVLLDFSHSDLRRARAAALNIVPTTTGAARAVSLVLPQLKGKLNGLAFRVPTPTVSVVDLVCTTKKPVTVESVNEAFDKAAAGDLKGILGVSYTPLVSSDYKGMHESTMVDGLSTLTMGENMVKIIAWYDNEWGYSARLVDVVRLLAEKGL